MLNYMGRRLATTRRRTSCGKNRSKEGTPLRRTSIRRPEPMELKRKGEKPGSMAKKVGRTRGKR